LKWRLGNRLVAWPLLQTAIILATVAVVSLNAYERVSEKLVMERDQN
jgi:hypothetical protein